MAAEESVLAAEESLQCRSSTAKDGKPAAAGGVRQTGTGPREGDRERHRGAKARVMVTTLMVVPEGNQTREGSVGY
jgi:hypothetical protein